MHYGTTIRCFDNINDWFKISEILQNDVAYAEVAIAIEIDTNRKVSYKTIVIPEAMFDLIKENNYEVFINLYPSICVDVYKENGDMFKLVSTNIEKERKRSTNE